MAHGPVHPGDAGKVPSVRLYSLQVRDGADQPRQPPYGMALTDLGPILTDWATTAAVMAEFDVIVSVATGGRLESTRILAVSMDYR